MNNEDNRIAANLVCILFWIAGISAISFFGVLWAVKAWEDGGPVWRMYLYYFVASIIARLLFAAAKAIMSATKGDK